MNTSTLFYWILGMVFTGFVITGMVIHRTRTTVKLIDSDLDQMMEFTRGPASETPKKIVIPTSIRYHVGELVVNVRDTSDETHYLKADIDLELFDEESRAIIAPKKAAIKHTIIQAVYEQEFDSLRTLGGKLYFKELVTSRLNTFVNHPAVKSVHFSSFYLQ